MHSCVLDPGMVSVCSHPWIICCPEICKLFSLSPFLSAWIHQRALRRFDFNLIRRRVERGIYQWEMNQVCGSLWPQGTDPVSSRWKREGLCRVMGEGWRSSPLSLSRVSRRETRDLTSDREQQNLPPPLFCCAQGSSEQTIHVCCGVLCKIWRRSALFEILTLLWKLRTVYPKAEI